MAPWFEPGDFDLLAHLDVTRPGLLAATPAIVAVERMTDPVERRALQLGWVEAPDVELAGYAVRALTRLAATPKLEEEVELALCVAIDRPELRTETLACIEAMWPPVSSGGALRDLVAELAQRADEPTKTLARSALRSLSDVDDRSR